MKEIQLLENITGKKVILEIAKPIVDINELENNYDSLSAKLKEILPENIREWALFKKQIESIYDFYIKWKSDEAFRVETSNSIEVGKWGLNSNRFLKHLEKLYAPAYKHSVFEILNDYENLGNQKGRVNHFLIEGGIFLQNIFDMVNFMVDKTNAYQKSQKGKAKEQELANLKTSSPDIYIPLGKREVLVKDLENIRKGGFKKIILPFHVWRSTIRLLAEAGINHIQSSEFIDIEPQVKTPMYMERIDFDEGPQNTNYSCSELKFSLPSLVTDDSIIKQQKELDRFYKTVASATARYKPTTIVFRTNSGEDVVDIDAEGKIAPNQAEPSHYRVDVSSEGLVTYLTKVLPNIKVKILNYE